MYYISSSGLCNKSKSGASCDIPPYDSHKDSFRRNEAKTNRKKRVFDTSTVSRMRTQNDKRGIVQIDEKLMMNMKILLVTLLILASLNISTLQLKVNGNHHSVREIILKFKLSVKKKDAVRQ